MPADVAQSESYPTTVQGPAGGDPRTAKSVRSMGSPLASRTKWLRARLEELTGQFVLCSAVSAAADTFTAEGHPFSEDDPMRVVSVGGALPGNITAGAIVYAAVIDSDTIKAKSTSGGSAIDLSTAGSGDIYLVRAVDAAAGLFAPASGGAGGTLPAGSLRDQLTYLRDNYGRKAANNIWSAANTFSGAVLQQNIFTRSGNSALDLFRDAVTLGDGDSTLDYTVDVYEIPDVTANRVYSLPAPLTGRMWKRFRRSGNANAFSAVVKYGATTIATFPGSNAGKSWALVETDGGSPAGWRTGSWGGAATANL